jgi:hypothetical protein
MTLVPVPKVTKRGIQEACKMEEVGRKRDKFATAHGANQDAPAILPVVLGTSLGEARVA